MIGFIIGLLAGGFVGMTATAMCVAANDRTESACAEAYERGKRDELEHVRSKLRECGDCVYRIRYIERGD